MNPMNWEYSRSLLSTEDCGTPEKRRKLDPTRSFVDNSCCLREINQEVLNESGKEKNILEEQTAVDPSLELPEIPKEITEINRQNVKLSTENAQLKELMIHQAREHETERTTAQKKIIELEDKLKSNSLSLKDIDFIRIQLEKAKAIIEKLTSQNTSLLEENKKLLSKVTRVNIRARSLKEELNSSSGTASLQEEAPTQDHYCENVENLRQQVTALKAKCDELTLKILDYMKSAGSRGEDHNLIQDPSSDELTDVNQDHEPPLGQRVEGEPDGIVERVTEMEQGEQSCCHLIQDPSPDQFTPDDKDESSPGQSVEDDPVGTVEKVAEREQEEQHRNNFTQDPSSDQFTPDDKDESSPGQSVEDDPVGTVEGEIETEPGEQSHYHLVQDPSSDKLTSDANDKDLSLSGAPVEDDPVGIVGGIIEIEPGEQSHYHLTQDPSSDKLTSDANDKDLSLSGAPVEDDPVGIVGGIIEIEPGEQSHYHLIQDPSSDKLTSDANDKDLSLSGAPVEDDPVGIVGGEIETEPGEQSHYHLIQDPSSDKLTQNESSSEKNIDDDPDGTIGRETQKQNLRITVGRHEYLVSDAKFFDINWKEEYTTNYGGSKKMKCKRCPKQSANQHYLQDHIWSEHYGENFQCAYCEDHSKNYALRANLRRHVHKYHPEVCQCAK